ncbi:MAG: dihydroorotate dehydrogenase electron transfer subunit [Candidatus Omnitrophica bacterium]|nr:dihydroorotate dehydrogenase electron transfer subunit [Candidatus Omnitrophota bacterium]
MRLNKTFQFITRIIENRKIKATYWRALLAAPQIASNALPGQFVQIWFGNNQEVFLRRPFSIHRVRGERLEILYQVLGSGTEAFSKKKPGGSLDIIGPLGSGFKLPAATRKIKPVIVAGGMGVAPLVFLAKKLAGIPKRVLIGAKTSGQILCEKEFKELDCDVKIATDDGSRGFKGYVSDLLKKELSDIGYQSVQIYACGPEPLLKKVAAISSKHNIPAQISLEEHMACGIGACLGCAINTHAGFQRVCKEGPVFDAKEIVW